MSDFHHGYRDGKTSWSFLSRFEQVAYALCSLVGWASFIGAFFLSGWAILAAIFACMLTAAVQIKLMGQGIARMQRQATRGFSRALALEFVKKIKEEEVEKTS